MFQSPQATVESTEWACLGGMEPYRDKVFEHIAVVEPVGVFESWVLAFG